MIAKQEKIINPSRFWYVLLDWGGNIEDREAMTAHEAKKRNEKINEDGERLIRWAPEDGEIKNVYLC